MKEKNLIEFVGVRLTPQEKKRLKKDSEITGLPMSEVARRRIFGRPLVPRIEMVLIEELRRQGGLLKHNFEILRQANIDKSVLKIQEEVLGNLKKMGKLVEKIGTELTSPRGIGHDYDR